MTTASLERYAYFGLVAGLGVIQLTIFGYVPLLIGAFFWFAIVARERRWPAAPAFFVPLLALAAWTLVSSAFSMHPAASFFRDRQMLFFLIVPMTLRVARGRLAMRAVDVVTAVGAASALIGIIEYLALGYDSEAHRPLGLLGHYMTYSGVLMLVLCTAIGRLVFRTGDWIWPAVALPALLVALAVTESRNAWVGALLAAICLLSIRNWKLLITVPAVLAVFAVAAPPALKARALSTFDSGNATIRDRISMLKSGEAMIADHPLVGVGPNMVPEAYVEKYKRADAVDPLDQPAATRGLRSHLHDVPVQLAAERGLPALAAWLWFIAVAARDLWRQARRGPAANLAATGLAVLVAAVVAGLFEHNFGDSEFLALFLGLISLPFAAAQATPASPGTEFVPLSSSIAPVEARA